MARQSSNTTARGITVLTLAFSAAMAWWNGLSASAAEADLLAAVSGTWVLQQASSRQELESLLTRAIAPAIATPHVRGFCLRVPWRAIEGDFSLLDAGLKIAQQHRLAFSVRFMAGRHTPETVFQKGCRYYLGGRTGQEKVPVPFLADGSPNLLFESAYKQLVERLARWCRANGVHLLHLAWYGQDWAELNHGKEVRAVPGYSYQAWLQGHLRLIDMGLKTAGRDLAVEFPFSGYGPLAETAPKLADYVVQKIGPKNPLFFCQANGWSSDGDWGAPSAETEARFSQAWSRPICRAEQARQAADYDWPAAFGRLYRNNATYCEIYASSFLLAHKAQLADEIRKFAEHAQTLAKVRKK